MELKYIVYITINQCNGKFYIGVHRTNPDVFDGYIGNGIYRQSDANRREQGRPLATAVKKYGYENFKRTTISIFPDTKEGKEAAYMLEAQIVTETLIKSKQCYNVQVGGIVSRHVTKPVYKYDQKGKYLGTYPSALEAALSLQNITNYESAKKAIANCCLGTTNSAFGFVWSYESKFTNITIESKKVAQYTLSGKFLRYFDNIREVQNELHLKGVYQAIATNSSLGNYQWKYYEGDDSDIAPLLNKNTKTRMLPIDMFDSNENFIESFDSIQDCVKKYPNLNVRQITKCVTNQIKSHKGYKFKYKVNNIV